MVAAPEIFPGRGFPRNPYHGRMTRRLPSRSAPAAATITVAAAMPVEMVKVTDGPAARIQLLRMGRNELRNGRALILRDRAHAEQVVAATRANLGAVSMPVDYDHQSVFGAREGVGGTAPAAGWIAPAALIATDEGIFADVEWTPAAAEKLRAREYRYISPVALHDKAGEVIRLVNPALTNTPAITDLMAVASYQETIMDLSALAAALGLPEAATIEEMIAAVNAMKEAAMTTASVDVAVAAAVEPLNAKLTTATAQVADLTKRLSAFHEKEAAAIVETACSAGKITPAQKAFWLDQAKTDLDATRDYLAAAPVVLKPGEALTTAADPQLTPGEPTAEQKAVAAKLGVDPKIYVKGA
jgi:phage I-like protein